MCSFLVKIRKKMSFFSLFSLYLLVVEGWEERKGTECWKAGGKQNGGSGVL